MEIRTLRYFLAVAREENMSRAAEQLHVTQPTLSKALKSLEKELGKKCGDDRSGRHVGAYQLPTDVCTSRGRTGTR